MNDSLLVFLYGIGCVPVVMVVAALAGWSRDIDPKVRAPRAELPVAKVVRR